MGIAEGRAAARGTGGGVPNIFSTMLEGITKVQERRRAEDTKRNEENRQFMRDIQKLEKVEELKRGTEEFKAEQERKTISQLIPGVGGKPAAGPAPATPAAPPIPGIPVGAAAKGELTAPAPAAAAPAQDAATFRPKGFTFGGVSFERKPSGAEIEADIEKEASAKARIKEKTDIAATKGKLATGRLVSKSNLETIAGIAHDLSSVYTKGVEEGGIGGAIQAGVSGAATKLGDIPIPGAGRVEVGGRFAESGAFPGKRQELILKMMPMLTQQATKAEGSVRLIEGVLRAIGQTIPDKATAPRTAKRQLEESLKSFYRFARAAELLGMDFDKVFKNIDEVTDAEVNTWVRGINAAAGRIKIEGAELEALDNLISEATSPLDKVIKPAKKGAGNLAQQRVQRANKIAKENPGLSREEIIKRVKQEVQ